MSMLQNREAMFVYIFCVNVAWISKRSNYGHSMKATPVFVIIVVVVIIVVIVVVVITVVIVVIIVIIILLMIKLWW